MQLVNNDGEVKLTIDLADLSGTVKGFFTRFRKAAVFNQSPPDLTLLDDGRGVLSSEAIEAHRAGISNDPAANEIMQELHTSLPDGTTLKDFAMGKDAPAFLEKLDVAIAKSQEHGFESITKNLTALKDTLSPQIVESRLAAEMRDAYEGKKGAVQVPAPETPAAPAVPPVPTTGTQTTPSQVPDWVPDIYKNGRLR